MNILVFDTETNGLPITWTSDNSDVNNWPRVIQLAWELFDETGFTLAKECHMIEPDGWTIPETEFFIEHGYSTETNSLDGIPMKFILDLFLKDVAKADLLVAHNMGFDYPVINCEMLRYGKKAKKIKTYCTKLESTEICGITAGPGKNKWPTLGEAYTFLTGKEPMGAHHADADVQMCKEVYLCLQDLF